MRWLQARLSWGWGRLKEPTEPRRKNSRSTDVLGRDCLPTNSGLRWYRDSERDMTKLPINLNDLLRQRTIEGDRIEYKTGWNPDPIIRTVCAFANDFENLGGG